MHQPRPNIVDTPRTLSTAYARVVINHIQQTRPDLLSSLLPTQLAHQDENDPLARCSLQEWHALMDIAESALGTRDLVPDLAGMFKPWHAGLLGFTLMTSGTVGTLASLLRQFHQLLNDVFDIEHGVDSGRFYLRLRTATAEQSPRLARMSLMVWAQRLRWLTGQPDLRLDAHFEGPAPSDIGPYRRVFGGEVKFDQHENTMWGDMACQSMPIVSRDPASHVLLRGQARQHLAQLSRAEGRFVDKLQGLIRARLETGKLSLEEVSAEMKLPSRTLQRRLEEAGLNFRLMVDDVRHSQALHYLRDTNMPLAEMASALGFADHASFNRAFKRWTGCSPGVFRRSRTHELDSADAVAAPAPHHHQG